MAEDKKQQPRLVDVNEKALAEATDKAWRSPNQGAANRGGWLRAILLLAPRAFGAYCLLWRWMAPRTAWSATAGTSAAQAGESDCR
ncbi:hypothetical protein [Hyphomicrobium sp.]|uniref:hypothetical protein n=1 Tax=Hyphomicrobium sp. TaxID=82 RepID=UPI001327D0FE|nr:hypothetical protein [Hyphomicrobium sp.]KAB2937245.1 MAG: hypothetical protein F9K20_20330 [Hyphomicrobium sp.]